MNRESGSPYERVRLPICFTRLDLNSFHSRLYFGDEALDGLFHGFNPRQMVYLYGSESCLRLAEILYIRSQLSRNEGEVGSKMVFLDGGCSFNYSLLTSLARQTMLDRTAVLRNVALSRAFTCFQLTNFIESKMQDIIEETGSKLLVISNFPSLYCDQDLEEDVGKEQFCRALLNLKTIIKSNDAVALVTNSRVVTSKRMRKLEILLKRTCSIMAKVTGQGSATQIVLEKHPSAPSRRLRISAIVNIELERFFEAD